MGTVVLCVAFLAMAAALAAGSGLNITVCRVVFYAGSGIFAVFYLSLFIWLAAYMRVPQLWAGMGKVISNVVALVVTIPSAALAQANDQAAHFARLCAVRGCSHLDDARRNARPRL